MKRAWREEVERRVRERTAELERADAAKRRFVMHLSHELRNPINGILGASRALDSGALAPAQRERAKTVAACASAITALVDGVLDLTGAETGATCFRREPFSPRAVLAGAARVLETHAAQANASLHIRVGNDVPASVLGDPARVQQIVVNFAANALKFAGGRIDLSVENAGGALTFRIADRGPGVSAAEQEQLFQSFARTCAARAAGIPGIGLGLAISRALAEGMNGSVGMDHREGGGAVFWARLPLEPNQRSAAPAIMPDFAGAHALIVEDSDYNAETLATILSGMGFFCEHANTAEAALARLRQRSFDVAFVDCDLPGMSGVELVRQVCGGKGEEKAARFIATTGYASAAVRQMCLAAGMDAFLTKPIALAQLHEALMPGAGTIPRSATRERAHVDAEIFDFLSGGTEAGRRASRDRFAEALEGSLQRLADGRQMGDREMLRRAAHQMIGQTRMVGAGELSQLAGEVEQRAPAAAEDELATLSGELECQVRKLVRELWGASLRAPIPA